MTGNPMNQGLSFQGSIMQSSFMLLVMAATGVLAVATAPATAQPIVSAPAADEKTVAPVPQREPQQPKAGVKLRPGTEETLRWGKPANGLRAAIVIRPAPAEAKAGDLPDLYLAVQNVSKAPVHLKDTTAAPKLRELYIKIDGKIQLAIVDEKPTLADVVLQPREVAFLLMFPAESKGPGERTAGLHIAESALKGTDQILVGDLRIENATAGHGLANS